MPQIPIYEPKTLYSRREVGPSRGPLAVSGGPPEAEYYRSLYDAGMATQRLGLVTIDKQNELQQKRDAVDVLDAANRFGDTEREYLSGALKKYGRQARGSVKSGTEWYDEKIMEFAGDLENDNQRMMFSKVVSAKRASGLNQLSVHEARQDAELRSQTAKAAVLSAEREVRMFANNEVRRESAINMALASFDDIFQSENDPEYHAAARSQLEGALRTAAIESLVEIDPERGLRLLEQDKWRESVGEHYPRLKRALEASEKQLGIDAAYTNLKGKYGNDYDKIFDVLSTPSNMKALGLTLAQATSLKNVIQAEEREHLARIDLAKENGRENEVNEIYRALIGDASGPNLARAMRLMQKSKYLKGADIYKIQNAIKTSAKPEEWKTNQALYSELIKGIHNRNLKVTKNDINLLRGPNKLSNEDANRLINELESTQKDGVPAINWYAKAEKLFISTWGPEKDPLNTAIFLRLPEFIAELSYEVQRDNLRGREIFVRAEELVGTYEKTDWWFDKGPSGRFPEMVKKGEYPYQRDTGTVSMQPQQELISEEARRSIIRALQKNGKEITEENIQKVYRQTVMDRLSPAP